MKRVYVVKLILRTDKVRKDKTCPIHIQVNLNGKRLLKLSTGESVRKENWNSKTQSLTGKGFGLLDKNLKQMVYELEEFIIENKSRKIFVTAQMIKEYFRNEDSYCYFNFFDNKFCKNRFPLITSSTREKYMLLRKSLKEFRPQLSLSEIDIDFLHEFRRFLIDKKKIGKGGVWNREKNLRATIKMAFDFNIITTYAFRNFKLNKPNCKNEALNLKELNSIVNVDLKGNTRLEEIRDKFLFACYTGLRFGDVMRLEWKNIENESIFIIQQKTKNPVSIPLNEEAKQIIGKQIQNKEKRKTVFRVVSNQKTNFILKELVELAKVEKNVTFHMARHTFGTVLGRTENAYTIAKLMGHKKLATSMIYVNTDENELRDKMENVNFVL